jgi:hypothetical protein
MLVYSPSRPTEYEGWVKKDRLHTGIPQQKRVLAEAGHPLPILIG